MRREAPSPFGMSLIDLLVCALAMVALLWVMNTRNSGHRGTGDEETSSAVAVLEQYGTSHIVTVRIGQRGRWWCELEIDDGTKEISGPCQAEGSHPAPKAAGQGVTVARPPGLGAKPLEVSWRIERPPMDGFRERLVITTENVIERNIEAEIGIAPCCHGSDPHYLRGTAFSGAGRSEWFALWHEANKLRSVLGKRGRMKGWIEAFRKGVRDGAIDPILIAFDSQRLSCIRLQRKRPAPSVKVVFEAEGDVRFLMPKGTRSGSTHARLVADYRTLLAGYTAGTP